MLKQRKLLLMTLAFTICAGVFLFPMTAYAEEESAVITIETDLNAVDQAIVTEEDTAMTGEDAAPDENADPGEETESGIPPYDGTGNITPDGTGTVIDNVFIEGNGLEFFTFSTEAGNIYYLVIDRERTTDNVYFLNAVTEADLLALAEKDGTTLTASTSGIPSTQGRATTADPTDEPETPDDPSVDKGGMSSGSLIFILIGVASVGGAGYYFKIVRPKQQRAAEGDGLDYGDEDDYVDYGDDEEVYGIGDDNGAENTENEE